jgi:hypothetical protein
MHQKAREETLMAFSVFDRIKEFIKDYNAWERKMKREREGFSPAS